MPVVKRHDCEHHLDAESRVWSNGPEPHDSPFGEVLVVALALGFCYLVGIVLQAGLQFLGMTPG